MTHRMVELGYDYSAIEPVINKDIMEIHYSKHYAAYVSGLRKAIDDSGKFVVLIIYSDEVVKLWFEKKTSETNTTLDITNS